MTFSRLPVRYEQVARVRKVPGTRLRPLSTARTHTTCQIHERVRGSRFAAPWRRVARGLGLGRTWRGDDGDDEGRFSRVCFAIVKTEQSMEISSWEGKGDVLCTNKKKIFSVVIYKQSQLSWVKNQEKVKMQGDRCDLCTPYKKVKKAILYRTPSCELHQGRQVPFERIATLAHQ